MRVAPGWRLPWKWPPPVADGLRDRARGRRPQRVRRGTGLCGSPAVGAPRDVTSRPHHRTLLLNGERAQPAGLALRPQWDGLEQGQQQLHLNLRQR